MYAVIDIGKTNKKITVYDEELRPVAFLKREFDSLNQNGLLVEDIEAVSQWMLAQLKILGARHPIEGIAVSTHGAALVCLDKDGKPSVPTVDYTNEVDSAVHEGFWRDVGDPAEIQRRTATAEIKPLINNGKLIWYLKKRWPQEFARTTHILFYPQYFGFILTGKIAADITYVGCHTYLWDYERWDWSDVADVLGVREMLPAKPGLSAERLGTLSAQTVDITGLSTDTAVTLGIHDSNSSLLPYLIKHDGDFILNSTGTWCVAMHPVEKVKFEADELGKMVFYNLSFRGKPIKTSIFLGGLEYSVYAETLMKHHNRNDWPVYDAALYTDILACCDRFLLPSIVPGSGQFPDSVARILDEGIIYNVDDVISGRRWPRAFDDYEGGFALANLSLAIQTLIALRRVGLKDGTEVFIEGGFRYNSSYRALLGSLLPNNPLFLTSLDEATSFGAALTVKALVEQVSVESLGNRVNLDKRPVEKAPIEGLGRYVTAFLEYLT